MSGSNRLSKQKPKPLTVPQQQRKAFSLSDSGTFTEGDLTISRGGLTISRENSRGGMMDASFERARSHQSSRGSVGTSGNSSRVGTQESLKDLHGNAPVFADTGFNVAIDDLEQIGVLGCGSSGVVRKVRHKHTGDILALKVIQLNVEDQVGPHTPSFSFSLPLPLSLRLPRH